DVSQQSRTETYAYDIGNRLYQYKNPVGQIKTLTYDYRGRLTDSSWSTNGPRVHISYDATRPVRIISFDGASTAITGFGYDEANNRIFEDQTLLSGSVMVPVSVVSRLTHGSAGAFDINLPVPGSADFTTECRS